MTNPNVDMLFVMKRKDGSFNVEMGISLERHPVHAYQASLCSLFPATFA